MGKMFLGYPDWGVHSTEVVISGGSWEPGLPLENVVDVDVSKVARSVDATTGSTVIDVAMISNNKIVKAVGIFNHNLQGVNATIRVRLGTVANMSSGVQYDSGILNIWDNVHPNNMPLWDIAADQDNDLSTAERVDRGYPVPFVIWTGETLPWLYMKIEIDDTSNIDGFIEIGRLWFGSGFQPDINFEPGAQLGWETSSESIEMDGGRLFHIDRALRRVATLMLPQVPDDEAYVHIWRMYQKLGTTGQLLFMYDVTDTVHMHRRAFLATFGGLSSFQAIHGSRVAIPVHLVEEI